MTERLPPDDDWIRLHYPRLLRGAGLLCENQTEAEDLVQETLIQAISHWHQFDGRCQEYTWLYAIMLRLNQKRRRSYARAARRLLQWWDLSGRHRTSDDPAKVVSDTQWKNNVWASVKQLPEAQAQAVFLRFAESMSYDEIAAAMCCGAETARTRVFYGLKSLRKMLGFEVLDLEQEHSPDTSELLPRPTTSLSHD